MNERADILKDATSLRPSQFLDRIAQWRRGGLPGGVPEAMVRKTRSAPMPALDRMDRELERAQRDYENCLKEAAKNLRTCAGLEAAYLFPIEIASPHLADLVSDSPCCSNCAIPSRRIRAGRCDACFQYRNAHDGVDRPRELWAS